MDEACLCSKPSSRSPFCSDKNLSYKGPTRPFSNWHPVSSLTSCPTALHHSHSSSHTGQGFPPQATQSCPRAFAPFPYYILSPYFIPLVHLPVSSLFTNVTSVRTNLVTPFNIITTSLAPCSQAPSHSTGFIFPHSMVHLVIYYVIYLLIMFAYIFITSLDHENINSLRAWSMDC